MRAYQLLPQLFYLDRIKSDPTVLEKLNAIGIDATLDDDTDVCDIIMKCRADVQDFKIGEEELSLKQAENVQKIQQEQAKLLYQDAENINMDGGPRDSAKDLKARIKSIDLNSHASSLGGVSMRSTTKAKSIVHQLPSCSSKTGSTGRTTSTRPSKQRAVNTKIPSISHPRPPPGSSRRPASPLNANKTVTATRGRPKAR